MSSEVGAPMPQRGGGLLQSAMRAGLQVGLFMVLQAVSFLLYRWGLVSSLVFLVGLVGVPIMLYRVVVRYRDNELGGSIRYMQAVAYMSWSYIFALIVGTVAYFVATWLLFNDPVWLGRVEESMQLLSQVMGNSDTYQLMEQSMRSITPQGFTLSTMTSALFFGLVYIYLASIFVRRNDGK